ncbi:MAG: TonB-dependent receptor plug domain-containing protein, partial [Bacteroidota bacterium]
MRKTITVIALMLAFTMQQAFAQRNLTGKVISKEDSKGIPGVSVVEVGTTNGTTTDGDGMYKLTVPETAKQIKFSGLGVKEQTVDIGASDVMDITMEADVQKLNEVVVTALGIKREEKSLGYATQSVSGAEITTAKEANFINSLQGRVAGVTISGSSNIGGSSRILLRGVRSINYENQPLFVIDGIPVNNGNYTTIDQRRGALGYDYGNAAQDINPEDIQDINILKGSSATALYGSQGANGAIIINSKKGTPRIKGEGKLPIGISLSTGMTWTKVAVLPEYQNRYGGGGSPEFKISNIHPELDANGDPLHNRVEFEYDGSWG